MNKDFGLREFLADARDYFLGDGNIPSVPYQLDSDWSKFYTKYEQQHIPGFETYNCTGFATTTQIEMHEKRLYGIEKNYSDRWVGIIAGTKHRMGNDPHTVYEAIRKHGLIPESMLPFTNDLDTPEEYFSFKGADEAKCREAGQKWLEKYEFKHDYVWRGTMPSNHLQVLREALQTSPIGLSVNAWDEVNGEYVNPSQTNNHWVLGVRMEGDKPQVFDSYLAGGSPIKTLAKDHHIRIAKRIYLNKRTKVAMKKHISILKMLIEFFTQKKSLENLNKPPMKTLLDICKEHIGTDVTPNDIIPDSVACADTVTTLLRKLDPTFPLVSGTYTLYDILEHRTDYEKVTQPSAETIILCATGLGNGTMRGHVGIFLDTVNIASNDSNTGKFMQNFTLDSWTRRYVNHGGFKIKMYKKKVV